MIRLTQENLPKLKHESYYRNFHRTFDSYNDDISRFEADEMDKFTEFFRQRHDSIEKKITWLDSGAGKGTAILTCGEISDYLEKAIGVSMHFIKGTSRILDVDFADWYLGDINDVLEDVKDIDVISDVYGPFFYSPERMYILRNYYEALDDGGKAFIQVGNPEANHEFVRDIVYEGKKRTLIQEYLDQYFPEIFRLTNFNFTLVMKKDKDKTFPNLEELDQVESYYSKLSSRDSTKYHAPGDKSNPRMPVFIYQKKDEEHNI